MSDKTHVKVQLTFKVETWKKKINGLLVDGSDKWSLLINNPVDYVCDGYLLINASTNVEHRYKKRKAWLEDVLILKTRKAKLPIIDLDTHVAMLNSLKALNRLIGVRNRDGKIIWIGKIQKIKTDRVTIKLLSTRANWLKPKTIMYRDLKVIEFASDYITTLELILDQNGL